MTSVNILPKILVISNYRSTIGVRPEAEIFIGLARLGFDVEIMTYGDAEYVSAFREAGIKVIDFHPSRKFDRKAVAMIRERLVDGGHNILQMYNSKAYFNGLRAAKRLPVKVVFYRGTQANIHWYDPTLYLKYFHPRVDKVICNSLSVEEEFKTQAKFIDKNKFITINKGHRPAWYEGIEPADLRTFGVKSGSFVFVTIANARRVKGVIYLMKAINLLPPGMDIYVLLVGRGLETPEFRKLADQSSYGDRIIFTGFQPNPLEIDRACDVAILTSISAESLTKSVIEAMGVGTTPLITNIPGNLYLLEHAKSGLLVPPKNPQALADAMLLLFEKKTWCTEMGEAARERLTSKLHIDRTISEYAEFYSDLITENPVYKSKFDVL